MPRQYTPRIPFTCIQCGTDFSLPPSLVRKGGGKFCSKECFHQSRKIERICKQCGRSFVVHASEATDRRGIFCSNECHRLFRYGTFDERFWKKVAKGGADDCWEWAAARYRSGYGKFGIDNTVHPAHRVAWQIVNGPIPDGLEVCHDCDNPPCVNPAHLFLATHLENMHDRDRKGRHSSGERPRGQRHYAAKLTEDAVRHIRRCTHADAEWLATHYGVSPNTVLGILYRMSWRHID